MSQMSLREKPELCHQIIFSEENKGRFEIRISVVDVVVVVVVTGVGNVVDAVKVVIVAIVTLEIITF